MSDETGTQSLFDRLKKGRSTTQETEQTLEQSGIEVASGKDLDIGKNPIYSTLYKDASDEDIIRELVKAFKENPDLSKEENLARIAKFVAFNKYSSEQMTGMVKKLVEFTDDKAFSLYDQSLKNVEDHVNYFEAKIRPMVRALQLMQEAEKQGEDPEKLIREVQAMHNERKLVYDQINSLRHKAEPLGYLNENIDDLVDALKEGLNSDDALLAAEKNTFADKQADEEKVKNSWSFFKGKAVEEATQATRLARDNVAGREKRISDARSILEKISESSQKLDELNTQLKDDSDVNAISVLIEITGEEYGKESGELVSRVRQIIEDSIKQFDESTLRFENLEDSMQQVLNSTDNTTDKFNLLILAANTAFTEMKSNLEKKETELVKFQENEENADYKSPEHAKLDAETRDLTEYLNVFLPTNDSAKMFQSVLIDSKASLEPTLLSVRSNRREAEELKLSGTVSIALNLFTTLKSLEAAVTARKVSSLRDKFGRVNKMTSEATNQLFDDLLKSYKSKSDRLEGQVLDAMAKKSALDEVTSKLTENNINAAEATEVLNRAGKRLEESAENLRNTTANSRRKAEDKYSKDGIDKSLDDLEKATGEE